MNNGVLLFLVSWSPPQTYLDELANLYPDLKVLVHEVASSNKELPKEISDETWATVTILVTLFHFPTKEQAPKLRFVQLISAGCNQIIGKPVYEDTEIAFCTANGIHGPQIAEWVIATFLSFQHHLYTYYDNQKEQKWVHPKSDEDTEDAVRLRMGILGYGSIGRQVAGLGKALGMDCHAYTLHEKATPESKKDHAYTEPGLGDPEGEIPSKWFFGADQLHDFLASDLDLLVITLPLTPLTRGMITSKQLEILSKKKAFLSNIARGPIVHTEDLIVALEKGKIRGAALDVTDPEPLPEDHPLWRAPNVIITPHCSGNSYSYNERLLRLLGQNLDHLVKGQPLINKVDRSLGY